jgi:hypothetical protein
MIIKPPVLAYFSSSSSDSASVQAFIEKAVNNIVSTHGFLPQSEPEDTIWLIY